MIKEILVLILVRVSTISSIDFIDNNLAPPDPSVCHTNECYASAQNLLDSIDFAADPCNDFYQYACGKWSENHPKKSEYEYSDTMAIRKRQNSAENLAFLKQPNSPSEPKCVHDVRQLFASCLDTDSIDQNGIKPLKDLLKLVNLTDSPPILSQSPNFDLILTTTRMQKLLGIAMFFSIIIQRNPYNGTQNIVTINRPGLQNSPLPTIAFPFLNKFKKTNEFAALKDAYISSVFAELCDNSSSELCGKALSLGDALAAAFALNKLERYTQTLQEVKMKPNPSMNYKYVIFTLGKLQNFTDKLASEMNVTSLNWTRILDLSFPGAENGIEDDLKLLIEEKFIEDMLRFINSFSLIEHELGSWWAVVDSLAEYSVSRLRVTKTNLLDTLLGNETRETWCERAVSQMYGAVVGYRYSIDELYNTTKHKVQEIVKNIREVFVNLINSTSWMDQTTKNKAMNKVQSMKAYVAFPGADSENDTADIGKELDDYFQDYNITDDFLESTLIRIQTDSSRLNLNLLKQQNRGLDFNEFFLFLPPVLVNAFHAYELNSLLVPAGLLGFPLSGNGLEALNYGSIGTVIGHEMTHGFDVQGRNFNGNGDMENWWEPHTLQMYHDRTKCLIGAYDNLKISGANTLSENLADQGAFKEALLAYRLHVSRNGAELKLPFFQNYTHEQLYTLGFATTWCESASIFSEHIERFQVHSKNAVRVNGVVRNSHEFSNIWNCTDAVETRKIEDECHLW